MSDKPDPHQQSRPNSAYVSPDPQERGGSEHAQHSGFHGKCPECRTRFAAEQERGGDPAPFTAPLGQPISHEQAAEAMDRVGAALSPERGGASIDLDQADETIDIFDAVVRERDELRAEVERLKAIIRELDRIYVEDTEVERLRAGLQGLRTAMDASPRMMTERQVKAALDTLLVQT